MHIFDLVMRLNGRPFLHETKDEIDPARVKKIIAIALKILFFGTYLHYRPNPFALGLTLGILAKSITKKDFKFQELQCWIDKEPLSFVKIVLMAHIVFHPASFNLGPIAGGFYGGIGIAKLCK